MWYDEIVQKIKQINIKVMQVTITANPDNINNIIGHKKENVLKLKELYDVDVVVKPDENIKKWRYEESLKRTKERRPDILEEKTYGER